MAAIDRPTLLKLAAGAVVGLLLLDSLIIEPAIHRWGEQSERIEALQKKVTKGRSLMEREDRLHNLWAAMQRANLPADPSAAEAAVYGAVSRWQSGSGVSATSYGGQWQSHDDEGYSAYEVRMALLGDQAALGRFLYELGTDPLPCSVEECEIATRDAHGQQLALTARFSFVRVAPEIFAGVTTGTSTRQNSRGGNRNE